MNYITAALPLVSGHSGLEIKIQCYCTLYGTERYTKAQAVVKDVHVCQCMSDAWTNMLLDVRRHIIIFESSQLWTFEDSCVGDSCIGSYEQSSGLGKDIPLQGMCGTEISYKSVVPGSALSAASSDLFMMLFSNPNLILESDFWGCVLLTCVFFFFAVSYSSSKSQFILYMEIQRNTKFQG